MTATKRTPSVGLGVVTYRRPEYLARALASIGKHLRDVVDAVSVQDDGGGLPRWKPGPHRLRGGLTVDFQRSPRNEGVGKAKNRLLGRMLSAKFVSYDWLFIAEDDLEVTSPLAITGYLSACAESGWEHLCFHGHGPLNRGLGPVEVGAAVTLWPEFVGAWCCYSRRSLDVAGLMDEEFESSWEHVEHSTRLARAGFAPPGRVSADATGSENWLREQPGAIESSHIRAVTADWHGGLERGREHWRKTYPETYDLVFDWDRRPPDAPSPPGVPPLGIRGW